MEVGVYTSFEQAEPIRREWDQFAERVGGDVFSSFDWCRIWWRHYGKGRRLEIYTVRDGGRLVAVLPLVRERWVWGLGCRTVRLVGCDTSPGSLYVTVLPERMTDVVRLVVDHLGRSSPWDLICFHRLAGYFEHSQELATAFLRCPQVRGVRYYGDNGPHIVFDLAATYEGWLARLTAKERSNIRRRERLLARDYVVQCREADGDSELQLAAGRVMEMHQRQWRNRGLPGSFAEWPHAEAFYRDMIEAQQRYRRVLITELWADDQVVAAEYSLCFGKRVHWIVSARDDGEQWRVYSPGRLGFCGLVRRAIARGLNQIDALTGEFHYKRLLGGRALKEQAVWVFRRGFGARCRVLAFRAVATLLHICYAKIWAFGLGRKLGLVRYPHWEVWIRSEFDRRLRARGRWMSSAAV